jgi:hypothetical protein
VCRSWPWLKYLSRIELIIVGSRSPEIADALYTDALSTDALSTDALSTDALSTDDE